jgi:GNAT superfamily N-acetyltransferase
VDPEVVRPLRQRVLRPHQTLAEQVFDGDDAPAAAHFAAYADRGAGDEPVGIASITPEPFPGAGGARAGDFRVRGMATDPERGGRGTGAGGALLLACVEHARAAGGARVWCNARTPARGFYERAGFVAEGEEFALPGIGPHFLMSLVLGVQRGAGVVPRGAG